MFKKTFHEMMDSLDKMFFMPLIDGETIESRASNIEKFIVDNGWTWDMILNHMQYEKN